MPGKQGAANMSKTTVKTTGEYFRFTDDNRKFATPTEAINAVFAYFLTCNTSGVVVQRVTTHEPVDGGIFGDITETVTGEEYISGPSQISRSPELSRYNPVNGCSVPVEIEIGE